MIKLIALIGDKPNQSEKIPPHLYIKILKSVFNVSMYRIRGDLDGIISNIDSFETVFT